MGVERKNGRERVFAVKKRMTSARARPNKNADEEAGTSAFPQKLIDSIPIPVFYKDIRGVYLGGNQAFADFLGRKMEDIVGKTVHEIAPEDLAEEYERADKELFRREGIQTYESAIVHADGARHKVIFNKATFSNRDGVVSGLIGSIFDIAQRKEVEERLRRNEERYRRIFENIQDVYYEVGLDGAILELSPSIERYFQFKREDLIGRSIYEFYSDKNRRKALLQEIEEKGYVRDFEIHLRDRRGAQFTCSITASIMPGEGERPPRIAGSMRDISERKRDEETLRQREEELSIKSRNLEEVNTALKVLLKQREEDRKELEENVLANVKTSLLPYLEKLKKGPLTQRQRAYLEILEAQMKKIISPFLHRISQACFDLTPQEIRVADFVKNGNTTKEIADILRISIKTVDYHRDNIRRKMGIKNHHTNLRSFLLKLS
ncbi:MAG: PAS domain S-box protein [Proteobacteria bacterium]|nr:PAS domain S-box protein [Pseudomonadota bacterium]